MILGGAASLDEARLASRLPAGLSQDLQKGVRGQIIGTGAGKQDPAWF